MSRGNFTEEEIHSFINMGKQLASKAVLSMLIKVIEAGPARGRSVTECDLLIDKIKARMSYGYSGYLQCEFDDLELKLNISLSIVDRSYRTEVDIPDIKYANDLYRKYIFLKDTAVAYWRQFVEEHPELYKDVCTYRSDIDFTALIIDKDNPTTMYFDPNSPKRIGIFCYYVDSNNNPLRKKPC